ncbi:hypothetical protein [Pectobacterium brasiliense]|uniref:hypothetical protein n=1 Tax=Pectobacterium brasiliense TaxID=180957 RepID=UPI001968B31D|nr:hypothetical protein [Pectobacterium brasiliense]MBN3230126.1 hypothetical protein [Pectobacterium brasiliense]
MKILNKKKIIKYYLMISFFIFSLFFIYKCFFISNEHEFSTFNKVEEVKVTNLNISWWFFTVVITAGVTYAFQNKLAKNKLKLDRLDKRASFIKTIAKDLSDLVNYRLYAVKIYCEGISSGGVSDSTREHYRKSVSEWNSKIHSIYSSLNMYDIVDLSTEIESDIHNEFVRIHNLFVKNTEKKDVEPVVIFEIKKSIHQIGNKSSFYSRVISEMADASWDKTLDKTEPLTQYNLPIASNLTLVKRLFNFNRSSLSVNRSIYKE